jgi:diguanylate cyclase (GGDEF)-like protein
VSFRGRLTLFFVLIVALPMVAIAALVVSISNDSRSGKADARLAQGLATAQSLYREDLARATRAAREIADDPEVQAAIRSGDPRSLRNALLPAAGRSGAAAASIELAGETGAPAIGSRRALGTARVAVRSPAGQETAAILASSTTADAFARKVQRATGLDVAIIGDSGRLASTVDVHTADVPDSGDSKDVDVGSETLRAASTNLGGARPAQLTLLGPVESKGFFSSSPAVLAALIVFFIIALVGIAMVQRMLGGQHELVSEQAVTDDLTGLSNKRRFRELLDKEAARAGRFGHELSLLMLDIDDFKSVNDTHGHLQGDEVLRGVARALDSESRGVDEPARYGGEEFAIALPETGLEGALEVGERIRARIAGQEVERLDGEGKISVTASLGAATMANGDQDVEALIAAADAALYEAKAAGKDRVVGAKPE